MRKITFILMMALLVTTTAMAQKAKTKKDSTPRFKQEMMKEAPVENDKNVDKEALHEKMMKEKYDIFMKYLELTPEEMDKFWNMYQEYDKELFSVHENYWKKVDVMTKEYKDEKGDIDFLKLEPELAEKLLSMKQENDKELFDINEKYTTKFHDVLPPQKILKLQKEEKFFVRSLMKCCQKEDESHQNKHGRNK